MTDSYILQVQDLQKSFSTADKRQVKIVDVHDFALNMNEQLGIEGVSGSGKTTFLNLIAGILQPDNGKIIFNNEEVSCLSEAKRDLWRAENIGYVFQTFNLLQGYSALENIILGQAFGHGVDEKFARHLLQRVNLIKHMDYKPRQMSIGQQQRVAVARALANKPKLVLADEPTGNLDRQHAEETVALIQEVCREHGAALLLVSHDPHMLSKFKKVIKMSQINKAGHS